MEDFIFAKLEVYKKAVEFIVKIIDLVAKIPSRIRYSLGSELIKTSVSIANNIAEGSGRRGNKEKRQFYDIAKGSTFECIPMLTILCKKDFIEEMEFTGLYNDCLVMAKMISGLIKSQNNPATNF